MPTESSANNLADSVTHLPIEIGIIMTGRFDSIDRQATRQARDDFKATLQHCFPEFSWRIVLVKREELATNVRHEPSALLEDGCQIRGAREWDFAFVITSADLKARYKPYALAALSNALDSAVISTSRIDPQSYQDGLPESERLQILSVRLLTLLLHAFGHLNGLIFKGEKASLILDLHSEEHSVERSSLTAEQCDAMRNNLRETADLRLEEQADKQSMSRLRFYLHSSWINRHEIYNAVRQARPWQFPARLVRLSAAALSATLVLLLTAEVWHLALTQALAKTSLLLVIALLFTTGFVAIRQRLFVQRALHKLSEQSVITNVSAASIVFLGMLTTALLLLLASLLFSLLLYTPALIESWTDTAASGISFKDYLQTSMFVTTLGLLIGALGASFEDQYYFRHIVFVDEEAE